MRSAVVTLTLLPLGAMTLSHAFPAHEMKRNLYPDRATCEQDYSPQQCGQGVGSGSGYASSSWHGPYYYSNRSSSQATGDAGPGRMGWSTATQVSMRGGFGSFGRTASASS